MAKKKGKKGRREPKAKQEAGEYGFLLDGAIRCANARQLYLLSERKRDVVTWTIFDQFSGRQVAVYYPQNRRLYTPMAEGQTVPSFRHAFDLIAANRPAKAAA